MADLDVVAIITAATGEEDAVRDALTTLAGASLAEEEGCLAYDLFESAAAPGTFVTVERWRSQDDLDAHMQTAHVEAAIGAVGDRLARPFEAHPLVPQS